MAANEKWVEEPGIVFLPDDGLSENRDVFGDDKNHQVESSYHYMSTPALQTDTHEIKYKTLSWPFVATIMTAEIVTGGIVTLPQALAVGGMVPGLIILVFCGVFALFTSLLLIDFKINHPEVHNMGTRDISSANLSALDYSDVKSYPLALATLSGSKLCVMTYTGIVAVVTTLCAMPRTFDSGLTWLSLASCISVVVACIVAMAGAGAEPAPDSYNGYRTVELLHSISGYYEPPDHPTSPRDAKKSAWYLQSFATTFYVVFAAVSYSYLGSQVQSPSLLSLPIKWAKAAFALFLPNLIIAASLYNHTAAKIIFVRIFRKSHHLHSHTFTGWAVWIGLVVLTNGIGFLLAIGVPIFSYLCGLAAALFASWYTYGLAGAFWWHDTYHLEGGWPALRERWIMFSVCIATFVVVDETDHGADIVLVNLPKAARMIAAGD
ncbi:hypothetical protein H2203_008154 [Taxawa tesnikishii (nom. ined.)]|nr:hypothetical protein H2203_008154 [Dothideales sp. JES 119]